jgi:hypothetical protein
VAGFRSDNQAFSDACHTRPYLGSQTAACGAKDNPVHNGSKRREARSHNFALSGPAEETSFPSREAGIPSSGWRMHPSGRRLDHSPLPHIASRQRLCARPGPAQTRRGLVCSSKLWEVNSLMYSRATGQLLETPLTRTAQTIPGPNSLIDHAERSARLSALAKKETRNGDSSSANGRID